MISNPSTTKQGGSIDKKQSSGSAEPVPAKDSHVPKEDEILP